MCVARPRLFAMSNVGYKQVVEHRGPAERRTPAATRHPSAMMASRNDRRIELYDFARRSMRARGLAGFTAKALFGQTSGFVRLARTIALAVLAQLWVASPGGAQSCVGDCDGDCRVDVAEVMSGVCLHNLNLFCRPCDALDANCNGSVAINELIQAVNNLLSGCHESCMPGNARSCATPSPTPTATATLTPTATVSPPEPLWSMIGDLLGRQGDCSSVYSVPSDGGTTVYCVWGPGHDSKLSLRRMANAAAAAEAVAAAATEGEEIDFFESPAYLWEKQFPSGSLDFNYRYLRAQIGCWFVAAQSFDDTSYRLAYHPLAMSSLVAEAFGEELSRRCK